VTGANDGRAQGRGRVYQASGDQYIVENHHHAPSWTGPDSVRHPAVGRAPKVLRDRTELMGRLKGALSDGARGEVFVLHGMGGCGKTAVAHAVFQYAKTEADRLALWVNSSDQASLRAGMLAVAADRGAEEGELGAARSGLRAAADLVWDRLDSSETPWLLVLDNADEPSVLSDGGWLRTSPRGTVLVTTRQAAPHWWPAAELLHVGVLPREDAARVLCDLAPDTGTVEDATAVADRLGRLPLALTLAGGFLSHQVIDPWTMTDYGRRLEAGDAASDPVALIDRGAPATRTVTEGDSRQLVSRTWQLSLDTLTGQGVPESVRLLRLLACWSSDPLPLSLLSGADLGPELPASRVELALRGLLDHSLTELVTDSGSRCLRTHGVLLDSVASGTPVEQRDALAAAAARLLLAVLPEVPQRGQQDERIKMLVSHGAMFLRRVVSWSSVAQEHVEAAAECVLRLVVAMHRMGDYTTTMSLVTEALELAKARLGEDHVLVLRLRQRYVVVLFRLGRFEEYETLGREVLADCERLLGPTSLDTLQSCLDLAAALCRVGPTPESAALMRRTLNGRSEQLGWLHPLTLQARIYMLQSLPRPELDEELLSAPDLVVDCRRALGPGHQLSLAAELDLAYALLHTEQPSAALPHAQKALAGLEKGPEAGHAMTLACRSLLAKILASLGRMEEAVEQAQIVVQGRVTSLGPAHPWTRLAQEQLGRYQESV
jgi:hypothetical protein